MASPDSHKKPPFPARGSNTNSTEERRSGEKKPRGRFSVDVDRLTSGKAARRLAAEDAYPAPSPILFEASLSFLRVGDIHVRVGWMVLAVCVGAAAFGLARYEALSEQLLAPTIFLGSLGIQVAALLLVSCALRIHSRNIVIGALGACDVTSSLQFLRSSKQPRKNASTLEGLPARPIRTQLPAVIRCLTVALSSIFAAHLLDQPWELFAASAAWNETTPLLADMNRFLSLAAMVPLFPNTAMMTWLVPGKLSVRSWQLQVVSASLVLSSAVAFLSGWPVLGVFFFALFGRHIWWRQHIQLESIAQRSLVQQAMIPWDGMLVLSHGLRFSEAKRRALGTDQEFIPVVIGKRCRALVKRQDLLRFPIQSEEDDTESLLSFLDEDELPHLSERLPLAQALSSLPALVTDEEGELTGLITSSQVKSYFLYSLSNSDDLSIPDSD